MRTENIVAALLVLIAPAVSVAQDASSLPEPETIALFVGAGVAWAIVHWIRRR